MNPSEALSFLKRQQPFPVNMEPGLLQQLDAALAGLINYTNPACIPVLLGSFADWDDFTLQETIQTLLVGFSEAQVIPHLAIALGAEDPIVRKWSADTARIFPHPQFVPQLADLLKVADVETRLIAASALECIGGQAARAAATAAAIGEQDEQVLEILQDVMLEEQS